MIKKVTVVMETRMKIWVSLFFFLGEIDER